MTFYHVQGPKSCNFDIDKNRFKWANGVFSSLFQCNFTSFVCQLLNFGIFANTDPGRMVFFNDALG